MRKRITLNEPVVVDDQKIKSSARTMGASMDPAEIRPFRDILRGEGSESFVNYIEYLGLQNDPNPVVLSSMHHYYYDAEEMKRVKTVVNLIKLNQLKEIKEFLCSISNILSPKSNLIGCFIDSRKQNLFMLRENTSRLESKRISTAVENGIMSRIPFLNRIYSIVDARTNRFLTKQNVTLLMEDHGFKIMDMTELDGLTYFHAKKNKATVN